MYGTYDQRYPFQVDTANVPRSYYYPTSDGSDSGSPGGGGGGGGSPGSSTAGGGASGALQSTAGTGQQNQIRPLISHAHSREDSPFNPPVRQSIPTRGFVQPPEQHLSGTLHSATLPAFGGQSQFETAQYGQFQQYHGHHHGDTQQHYPQSQLTLSQQSSSTGGGHGGSHGSTTHSHYGHHHPVGPSSTTPSSSTRSAYHHHSQTTVVPSALQRQPLFPDAGDYLRHQLGLPAGAPVSLACLPDPPPGRKPSQSYPILIKLAIYGSPHKRLTLKGIYEAIEDRFEHFRMDRSGAWKRSIRHNLSLNQVFKNTPRPITEPGKGSYWELDISQGEGYKRERKRRRKAPTQRRGQDMDSESLSGGDDEEESEISSPSRSESPAQRAGSSEQGGIGPFRTTSSTRRSSPYPAGEVSSRSVVAPRAFTAGGSELRGQYGSAPQGGAYHLPQPQPYRVGSVPSLPALSPGLGLGQESPSPAFRSAPFAQTMAWHAQQHLRHQQGLSRSAGVPPQFSYVPSSASSLAGPSASRVFPDPTGGMQVPVQVQGQSQASVGTTQYHEFGSGQQPSHGQIYEEREDYDTEGTSRSQGSQGSSGRGRHC